ncbi:MAG TPA: thermonuclease family protein [Roseobacter sp.]|uniref:TNase-like domain-containing protein n=1 Tax=marine sediment metagenome TaxID=412755 RepID=A0A0F9WC08_9ZZZZ|nr:thermonuclease family protein [Roseobacter sp.]
MQKGVIYICVLAVLLVVAVIRPVLAIADDSNVLWQECHPYERRITCVVDGDTLWYQGTKIRLLDIDAPEVEGRCVDERQLAQDATVEFTRLLNTCLVRIAFDGQDQYGRHLAQIWVREGEIGTAMLAAGLAEPFGQRGPSPWCG